MSRAKREPFTLRVRPETKSRLLHAAVDGRTFAGALVDRLTADYLDKLQVNPDDKPAA
ncbi:hypothetical protein HDR58_03355 [bacterium]|nr:hypothetical protein [bacterium]